MREKINQERWRHRGMSFIEMLGAFAAIGILATIGTKMMTKLPQQAEEQKLNIQVTTLNTSVKSYVASGGSLDGLTSAQ